MALEWPRSCAYWRRSQVKRALKRWRCVHTKLDGCMYGLVSVQATTRGTPLKKPWTIASTCDSFSGLGLLCDGSHRHVRTQGADTTVTEGYTDALADAVHSVWCRACRDRGRQHYEEEATLCSAPRCCSSASSPNSTCSRQARTEGDCKISRSHCTQAVPAGLG